MSKSPTLQARMVGTMQLVKNLAPDLALRNAVMLAKAAKAFDMPIVLSQGGMISGLAGVRLGPGIVFCSASWA